MPLLYCTVRSFDQGAGRYTTLRPLCAWPWGGTHALRAHGFTTQIERAGCTHITIGAAGCTRNKNIYDDYVSRAEWHYSAMQYADYDD